MVKQAKDIPDNLLLEMFARHQGQWAFWYDDNKFSWGFDSDQVFENPLAGVPRKIVLRKLQKLNKRGLIGGCPCGCRGDFEITDKGLESIGQKRTKPYRGY
jgi:hypothetical protein